MQIPLSQPPALHRSLTARSAYIGASRLGGDEVVAHPNCSSAQESIPAAAANNALNPSFLLAFKSLGGSHRPSPHVRNLKYGNSGRTCFQPCSTMSASRIIICQLKCSLPALSGRSQPMSDCGRKQKVSFSSIERVSGPCTARRIHVTSGLTRFAGRLNLTAEGNPAAS
jgi:hypothetical protein